MLGVVDWDQVKSAGVAIVGFTAFSLTSRELELGSSVYLAIDH